MAKTPAREGSGRPAKESPSRPSSATGARAVVLTTSAKLYADRHDLSERLAVLTPSAVIQTGDLVSVSAAGTRHDFAVLRRRWIFSETGAPTLEITLDHPVRG